MNLYNTNTVQIQIMPVMFILPKLGVSKNIINEKRVFYFRQRGESYESMIGLQCRHRD